MTSPPAPLLQGEGSGIPPSLAGKGTRGLGFSIHAMTKQSTSKSLPPGWRLVRFGDVVRNVNVNVRDPLESGLERYLGLDHLDPESLHIERWGLIADGTTFTRKFVTGQVLFGKRRAYQRKVAVAEFDGICSGDILVFEPANDQLLPELLPFIVQSDGFVEHALGTSAGSLSPRTKWKDLARYEFALPPKDEQRHIAEILWAADETIEKELAAWQTLEEFQSSLISSFLKGGMPGWHSEFTETPIGRIPKSWTCVKCGELFAEGPRNGLSPKTNAEGDGYPTLSIGAIRDGQVVIQGNVKYAIVAAEEAERFRLHRGDLLVVRGNGNRNLVGRCGMVDYVPDGCFYPDLLIRIGFDSSKMRPEFACIQWNAPQVHQRLLARAKSTNGIWKVNGNDLRQHILALPPMDEQDAFLRLIEPHRLTRKQLYEQLERTQELKKRLLDFLLNPVKSDHVH